MVRGDITALRSELQTLRTDFGAKIAMVEAGLQFAMPVNFAFNADQVRDEDHASLDKFARSPEVLSGSKVTIEGSRIPQDRTATTWRCLAVVPMRSRHTLPRRD
jgi:hypothetical protein